MIDQIHLGRMVALSRAHDCLNVGFGFRHAPTWLPIYATFRLTAFGIATGPVYSQDACE